MLDIKFIRENPNEVKKIILSRGMDSELVDIVLNKYKSLLKAQQEKEHLESRLNEISRDPGWGKDGRLIQPAGEIKKKLEPIQEAYRRLKVEFEDSLNQLPNTVLMNVPIGDETKNEEIKRFGGVPKFAFKPK